LCSAGEPLFGFLIGSDITEPRGQERIETSSARNKLLYFALLGLVIAERERVS
jgi:hypothetical protein